MLTVRPVGYRFGLREVLAIGRNKRKELSYEVACLLCGRVKWMIARTLELNATDRCRSCDKVRFHAENGSIYALYPQYSRELVLSYATRYYAIRRRCEGRSADKIWYGDRGIECRFDSVSEFLDYVFTLDECMNADLEIDRIDNDGHYEKGNLRFVTHQQNTRNKRHRGRKD